jgi:DinB superfamily
MAGPSDLTGRRDLEPGRNRSVSVRRWTIPDVVRFEEQDFTDAEFRECDLTRARLIGVVMPDVVIDGLVSNLVVNGVEVASYVDAELDRRHPVRLLIRSAEPNDLRQAHHQLRAGWRATIERLAELPAGSEQQRAGGEWSAAQTMRHLVFVHDSWFRRCCLGSVRPFTAIGLASPFVPDQAEQGLDPAADPPLEEILAVRDDQALELELWLATVTADELSAAAPVPAGPGWPPYANGKSVLQCLHVVLKEEWEHHGFCGRDLGLLDR